jgi:hypothetical protein
MYTPATYDEALKLKRHLSSLNLKYVHFHDQCGGQYFEFDEADPLTEQAVIDYFAGLGLTPRFTDDKLRFILDDGK